MATVGEGATPLMYVCQQGKENECLEILTKKVEAGSMMAHYY